MTTQATNKLTIKNLNAWFGAHHAVAEINLEIKEKSVTAIIGPSGCGKSTFIRCLNRMHETIAGARVEGEVLLDNENIYGANSDPVMLRRLIGMVFQRPNPFPTMSIYDNVAAGHLLMGKKRNAAMDEIVEQSLHKAALWDEVKDKLKKSGSSLSGGQQQRLCIARSIAIEPEVLLMDEPCSALDPIATLKIEDLIHDLRAQYTIVIVTHNMAQAARVSEETVFMLSEEGKPGKIIEVGPTNQIFTKPNDKRTEDYITGRFG